MLRDKESASSVSEQLQSRNSDGENWNGVGEFIPEKAKIYLIIGKNNREIKGGENFILEGENERGRDKAF